MSININGTRVKPVLPYYLLNDNHSIQYYISGSVKNDSSNNDWLRVTYLTLKPRGKDSIQTNDERERTILVRKLKQNLHIVAQERGGGVFIQYVSL